MSKIKIGIGIPTSDLIHPDFAIHSLTNIVSYTRKHLPDVKLFIRYETGVRTDRNRNVILTDFIEEGVDGILWLDSDMVYPADIIERYLELEKLHGEMSVIGCLYFKRSDDHKPIGYVDSGNPQKPFRPLMPNFISKGKIYEVTGLGYGGMYVPMEVYDKMGEDKWTHYGENFHNPHATEGNLTHDLVFCQDVKKAGFKIFLHGSIRPGHIGSKLITEDDFYHNFPPEVIPNTKVLVVIPATDKELAHKTAQVIGKRSGMDCDIQVIEDDKRLGYTQVINTAFKTNSSKYNFFVYTAQDVFVGQDCIKNAVVEATKKGAGLVAFNDGKWRGQLASFGMVECQWASKNYGGNLFYSGYKSHYGDTELTQLAKDRGCYSYAENAVMLEVDHDKALGEGKGVNKKDKKLYKKRVKTVVSNKELQEQFG